MLVVECATVFPYRGSQVHQYAQGLMNELTEMQNGWTRIALRFNGKGGCQLLMAKASLGNLFT